MVEKYGESSVSAAEIRAWCESRKKVPVDDDEPCVLNYDVRAESADPDDQDVKIVISSRRLL